MWAHTAAQALEQAATSDPDAVFLSATLPDMAVPQLCEALLERQLVSRAAPLLVLTPAHTPREKKLQALEAGAWDTIQLPMDAHELMLRVGRFIQGKLEADRMRADAQIDQVTGLYNWEGINQRAREVGAAAERFGRPLACVVLTAADDPEASPSLLPGEAIAVAESLRHSTRGSDVLARIGENEFAVIATDTPPEGARVLADRLRRASIPWEGSFPRRLRAGVYAVADLRAANLDPLELMRRATAASRTSLPD
jgi:two-component system, cell cycle response regulator